MTAGHRIGPEALPPGAVAPAAPVAPSSLATGSARIAPVALIVLLALLAALTAPAAAATGVHTTYLWHMHQPIYWPDAGTWDPGRYETAFETITLGHSQSDVAAIFAKDDRVGDYQRYPRDAIASILDLPQAGAQVSLAGSLIENLHGLGDAGWNGGLYAADWYRWYREARGWRDGGGRRRLDLVQVGFHHAIYPLMDLAAVRMDLACQQAVQAGAWGDTDLSRGFFPAETCFSERLIPALVEAGVEWAIVADLHLARACQGYPYQANLDNCDPPNPADQVNPPRAAWTATAISRGVTLKIPYPWGFTPHRARHVDPASGAVSEIVVVPAASAMGWNEGYGLYGTGEIDAIAAANDPARPMLILLAHDGDNAWSGGYSYYYENVGGFAHAAAARGYTPTTVAAYLQEHPVPADDVVHVEDGGWVNADGDFGSPQFVNWNWPLVDQAGAFDIPGGWAEDERNWAVLTAAQNRVETAAAIVGAIDPARVADPLLPGTTVAERAWHFLLAGYESGYMYYGQSLDMEVKATLACNEATLLADPIVAGGPDEVPPTIWLPERLPWNPGGLGGGSLWGYPGGEGAPMPSAFHVWTFVHDVSGLARVELMVREDRDGANDTATTDNELYAGGPDVGAWTALPMNRRVMPSGEPWPLPEIDFTELPRHVADECWLRLDGYEDVLLDYYVEAEDSLGNVERSPVQHVRVGTGGGASGWTLDGELDDGVPLLAAGDGLSLWAERRGGQLYVACQGVGATAGRDHFLLVCPETDATRAAPWAKAGRSVAWDWFLGAEDANGWCGWFDAGEAVRTGTGFACAMGTVLEGTLDLAGLTAGGEPAVVRLAALAYESPDGGALSGQAPAGDGDGDLGAAELLPLGLPLAAAPAPPAPALRLRLAPNPFNPAVVVRLEARRGERVRIDVHDLAGRHVATLLDGVVPGDRVRVRWDGRDRRGRPAPTGVYLFRARCAGRETSTLGTLVR